jgi:hypothetical protein
VHGLRSGQENAPVSVLLIMFRRFCRQNRSGRYKPSRAAEFSPSRPGRPRWGEAGEPTQSRAGARWRPRG